MLERPDPLLATRDIVYILYCLGIVENMANFREALDFVARMNKEL